MNEHDSTLGQRLDDMEAKLTFIDDAVQGLITADAALSQRLAMLERMLRDLRGEVSLMRVAQGEDARDEPPPPHY